MLKNVENLMFNCPKSAKKGIPAKPYVENFLKYYSTQGVF
jgi:hypothetical protein